MENVQTAVLRRYVAQVVLTELPTTCGFNLRGVSNPATLMHFAQSAAIEACDQSKLLRSHYHVSDVATACGVVLDWMEQEIKTTPNLPDLLIDQLAFYALRALHRAQGDVAAAVEQKDEVTP